MVKFIKNLFSSQTEQGDWEPWFDELEKESKYKPRLQKVYGVWYVVNMAEACFTEANSKARNNFWKAYYWAKEKNTK